MYIYIYICTGDRPHVKRPEDGSYKSVVIVVTRCLCGRFAVQLLIAVGVNDVPQGCAEDLGAKELQTAGDMYIYIYIYIYSCMCTYMCTYIYIYIYTHTHTYIVICIYTYTHKVYSYIPCEKKRAEDTQHRRPLNGLLCKAARRREGQGREREE